MSNQEQFTRHVVPAPAHRPIPDLRIFAVGRILRKQFANEVLHTDHNLIWISAGAGTVQIDNKGFDAGAGDFFFLPSGRRAVLEPLPRWDEYMITLTGERTFRWLEGGLIPPAGTTRHVPEPAQSRWRDELEAFVHLAGSGAPDLGLRLIPALERLLVEQDIATRQVDAAVPDDRVAEALRIMRRDPVGCGSPRAIAAAIGLSYAHFRRLFRDAQGSSPGQYLTELRCERARELLRDTDLPIKQVAADTGFNSSSAFCRTFRAVIGQSPNAYRRWISAGRQGRA